MELIPLQNFAEFIKEMTKNPELTVRTCSVQRGFSNPRTSQSLAH